MADKNEYTEQFVLNLVTDLPAARLRDQNNTTGPRQQVNLFTEQEILNTVFDEDNKALRF